MRIPDTKISLILYSIRDYCKTEKDLDSSFKRLKDIGFEAIQVSGVSLDPLVIKQKADAYGLYICASHESLDSIRADFEGIVNKLKIWDCDFTALGYPGDSFSTDPVKAGELIQELEMWGNRFAEHGIRFGYHNHSIEFAKAGSELFIDRLFAETSPTALYAEIDVYWVQRGGQNPADWIRKVEGRMPVCHFKDYKIVGWEPHFCEVGEGNLNWDEIISSCEETGVRWFCIEQDTPVEERDIFSSLELSYTNLRKMGVR